MGEKITVASKLPLGLTLRAHVARRITPPQGGNEITEYIPTGETVTLNGLNTPEAVRFGHAMTEVDKDFWDAWTEQHKDGPGFPPLEAGHIFAIADASDDGKPREREKAKTGLEPLDPDHPAPGIQRDTEADERPTRGRR